MIDTRKNTLLCFCEWLTNQGCTYETIACGDMDEIEKMIDDYLEEIDGIRLPSLSKENEILEQRVNILREEIRSTYYILQMQAKKLEGY